MPRYTVAHAYTAVRDGQRLGPWQPGDQVELSDHDAQWVNRDSPGALAELAPKQERQARPAADRQHRGGANR